MMIKKLAIAVSSFALSVFAAGSDCNSSPADYDEQSAFMTLSRPDCEDLCNGDLYFFDLIEDNDSRKKRAAYKAKREADGDDDGEDACHILTQLTNACGNWH